VNVNGDEIYENNETFYVTLGHVFNTVVPFSVTMLSEGTATGTIMNDDLPPMVTISDPVCQEGGACVFTVTISDSHLGPTQFQDAITVDYSTHDGTATAGLDYVATSGTLTFQPGDYMHTISVSSMSDIIDEPDETFEVVLTNSQADFRDSQGTAVITDGP
jgi:chitinase